jgi:cobalamin biosynthesis protein CobW
MTTWVLESRAVRAWTKRGGRHDHGDSHEGGHEAEHGHTHANQLVAVTFSDTSPLVGDRVLRVIDALGPTLVRAKGFVYLAGEARRGFVERAGIRTSLELRDPWGQAPRITELVLIGDDLDEAAVRRALWACRAGA